MSEGARQAESGDLDAMVAIAHRVAAEIATGRGGDLLLAREAGLGPIRDRIERAIDSDGTGARAVVGTFADVVLGWGLAKVELLADGRRLGVIEALLVEPEARAVGIGEAMMNLLMADLATLGCFGVDCRALPGDRETKNFFESFGLKARLLTVHRALDP